LPSLKYHGKDSTMIEFKGDLPANHAEYFLKNIHHLKLLEMI